MHRDAKRLRVLALIALMLMVIAPLAHADDRDPRVIEGEVLLSGPLPEAPSDSGLLVQATSLAGARYRYVLTVLNETPWPIRSLRLLDRYFPPDPAVPEQTAQWFPRTLEPGRSVSTVITVPGAPLAEACHQLEISVADGLGTILMDCSAPGATTVWFVPISPAMADYLALPPLTLDAPEGPSKVGLHVTRNSSPAIMDFVRQAQPAVVVSVEDFGLLTAIKAASPGTITVARLLEADQAMTGDPVERARAFVAERRATYLANPQVDFWLGWNEPGIDGRAEMTWFAAFEAERAQQMATLGKKVAIGNFSVGSPEPDEFEPFIDAIAVALENGGVLALHEYSAPTMRDGIGAGVPGVPPDDQYGALTLRYRIWYDHYLRAHDLVIPLIITEAGIDGGVLAKQGITMGGWRDALITSRPGGNTESATLAYLEQLSWYDDELRRDPYVLGFAIFNAGDADGEWATYDLTDILPELSYLALSK
ncbi:MAG: hypothetical protein GX657_02780 [Chloroflexi bacterium]|nr:hypothetical protein [Chloroflexota bacterium]